LRDQVSFFVVLPAPCGGRGEKWFAFCTTNSRGKRKGSLRNKSIVQASFHALVATVYFRTISSFLIFKSQYWQRNSKLSWFTTSNRVFMGSLLVIHFGLLHFTMSSIVLGKLSCFFSMT